MDIVFVGIGYVGLVSSVMMSYLGHNVTCIDTDILKIEQLNAGILPIYEPNLAEYFKQAIACGRLRFVSNYSEIAKVQVVFITVGTPPLPSGNADTSFVLSAFNNIINQLEKDSIIIIKSTVPPGTCRDIVSRLHEKNKQCHVVSNPEFLREGCAVEDFLSPDRIVIGVESDYAKLMLEEIYRPLFIRNILCIWTDLSTSELIKYASNAFLATKIAFINEMANLCEMIDTNVESLSIGMSSDRRIGAGFLKAGPGFGGTCFPKDIAALSQYAKSYGLDCLVLNAVIKSNSLRYSDMVKKICNIMKMDIAGLTFAVLGLTFKAGTDDIRHSPAVEIIRLLQAQAAIVMAYDPQVSDAQLQRLCASDSSITIELKNSAIEICDGADALIITTEWPEFKMLDFDIIYNKLRAPIIIDLRNLLDPTLIKQKGFRYYGIGAYYGD